LTIFSSRRHCVQGREARGPTVRIGAGIQQGNGELEMPVFDRQQQRARGPSAGHAISALGPHGFVNIDAGL
jgi:hypothetical protein